MNLERQSKRTPRALRDRPNLTEQEQQHYVTFIELHSTRERGWGTRAITFGEIEAYLGLMSMISLDARERMIRIVRHLDSVYLKWQADENEKKDKNRKPERPNGPRQSRYQREDRRGRP